MIAGSSRTSWLRRAGWFVLLWIAGVGCLMIAALAFRLMMSATGLTE